MKNGAFDPSIVIALGCTLLLKMSVLLLYFSRGAVISTIGEMYMQVSPSVPPALRWKMIILPGLLSGILLIFIQFFVVFLGTGPAPSLGFPFLPHSTLTILFLASFFYLVIPPLPAFLVTSWTRRPFLGYRAGRLAGVLCAVILIVATVTYHIPDDALPTTVQSRSPLAGFAGVGIILNYTLSVLFHIVGIWLAMLGAFLGSRKWRRAFASEEERGSE
jgi:hypothetical protein